MTLSTPDDDSPVAAAGAPAQTGLTASGRLEATIALADFGSSEPQRVYLGRPRWLVPAGQRHRLTGQGAIAAAELHGERFLITGHRDMEEMIACNLRLVFALARRFRGRRVLYEDLVQEGTIGLVRAVEKFDHRRGQKFSTYAVVGRNVAPYPPYPLTAGS
jgi:hypothetical protein